MLKHIVILTREGADTLEELEKELGNNGVTLWKGMPEENLPLKEILFISDMEKVCNSLLVDGVAVLGWIGRGNTQEGFSGIPFLIEDLEEADCSYLKKIHSRFWKLPWDICETKRCRIREMTEEDLDALYKIYAGKEMTLYTEGPYEDREKEREYICSYIQYAYGFWGFGTWMVEEKESGEVIGRVGYNLREGYEDPELGFVITESRQRRGYAYEVCVDVLEVGRQEYGFVRVQALVKEENRASVGLLKKLGFLFIKEVMEKGEPYLLYRKRLCE